MKICENPYCKSQFEVTDKDRLFYGKMNVPEPKFCFDCRQRQKLAFRNERKLYRNTCALCKKPMISIYSSDKPFPVYCTTCWWGDQWNPLDYGRDFDFSKTFFEQFKELWDVVPKLGFLSLGDSTNSDYCNDGLRLLNCYLIFDGEQAKDSYYGETYVNIQDCADFLIMQRCELCYECVNCNDCYNVNYAQYSHNCSDSNFLLNCQGCRNCFGCTNLQQKEYYIFNKPYTKEEYEKIIASYDLGDYESVQKIKKQCEDFFMQYPHKYIHGLMNDNATGDNLNSCKDTLESYDSNNLRDCKYCTHMLLGANDCYDINIWGNNLSFAYNCAGIGEGGQNIIACYYCAFGVNNVYHSIYCMNGVDNLLGCVSLQHKKYCILNKQYTEEEYKKLEPRIIEHMKSTQEWSEFFPSSLSPFGYNETVADEYYPLSKVEAIAQGYNWKDPDPREYQAQTYQIPESIHDVSDEIVKEILACITCKKNFKINAPELVLYRKKYIPIPRKCADCRHKDRLKLRNPRKLFDRTCAKCLKKIQTTYDPKRLEIVYCEECYLKEVY